MKVSRCIRCCIISLFFFLTLAPQSFSQSLHELKVKGQFYDRPLQAALIHLEIGYKLDFEFKKEELEEFRVNVAFGKRPLPEAMKLLLTGTGLDFELEEPNLVRIFKRTGKIVPKALSAASRFNITIEGTIKDSDSGETLPYANVRLAGTKIGTTTNVDGYFSLFNVPSDTSLLEIKYLGYQNLSFRLSPDMDLDNLNIFMEDFDVELEEVLILSEREEQLMEASTGISTISVSPAQLATLPSFGEKDIFRSLQLLPGVSGSNESSSGLFVRGGTPDQNLVLFDGFTVYHVDHLFGFFSAFNTEAIKDVQLYKGGFEAKYGGRISSVVDLTGKNGNTERFNAGFGASLVSVNAFVESPFANGKGSFMVAGRRSFQSSFYNNLFDSFTESSGTEQGPPGGLGGRFGQIEVQPNSYFYDLNAKVTYRPNSKDVISLSFYNGQDNLDNSRNLDNNSLGGRGPFGGGNANFTFNSNNTDLTNWGNWGSSLKWSRKWNEKFYSKANLSYSNYYSERDRRNETSITREDTTIERNNGSYEFNDLKDVTFKLDNEWKLSPQNQLDFGLQSTYNDIKYQFTQNDSISLLDRDDIGATNSLYLQDRHIFFDKLLVKGGLRVSHYGVNDQWYVEPRASMSYSLTNKLKLKAAWGQYYQFATRIVREDIQQGSRDFWLLADGNRVPVSYAEHYIAGLSYETNGWLFDVEAYYKNLDGLSEYTTRLSRSGFGPNQSLDYQELFYQGTGVARGTEFLIQKKVGKFTGWLSYTLGEVLYDFEAFGDEPFNANQDQTHELKLVGSFKVRNWTFGSSFIYATGRPYTAPTGFYEVSLLDGTTADFFEVSDKNALRFPNYHRLDLSATYDFKLGQSPSSFGVSIFNLYDRRNVWYKEYEVIEGELIETDISLLSLTPSFFFTWKLR
ncbi:MAG: TonB-dependent receptor [Bacteroidota bacterium]